MKRIIAIIFYGMIILQTGCLKNGIDEERLLSDEIKSQNPYRENNKLYFVTDSAQVLVLNVASRRNEIFEYQNGNYATNYLVERDLTSIVSLDSTKPFFFIMEMNGYYRPPELKILFNTPTKIGMSAYFDLPFTYDHPKYTGAVEVNGKWHYNVFVEEVEKVDSNAYRLYYSTELGIIKIDFSDSSTWELEKIE